MEKRRIKSSIWDVPSLRCLLDVPSREVRWAVEFMILEPSVEIRLGTTRGWHLKQWPGRRSPGTPAGERGAGELWGLRGGLGVLRCQ